MKGEHKMEKNQKQLKIELIGFKEGDSTQALAVYAVRRDLSILETSAVDSKGQFKLSADVLGKAYQVMIGPKMDKLKGADKQVFACINSKR
jgi:hypothetical protein